MKQVEIYLSSLTSPNQNLTSRSDQKRYPHSWVVLQETKYTSIQFIALTVISWPPQLTIYMYSFTQKTINTFLLLHFFIHTEYIIHIKCNTSVLLYKGKISPFFVKFQSRNQISPFFVKIQSSIQISPFFVKFQSSIQISPFFVKFQSSIQISPFFVKFQSRIQAASKSRLTEPLHSVIQY